MRSTPAFALLLLASWAGACADPAASPGSAEAPARPAASPGPAGAPAPTPQPGPPDAGPVDPSWVAQRV